jgi:hypothetical protein
MQTPMPKQIAALDTPVALLIFNRPDLTQQLFEVVRQVKPRRLLVVADGPRNEEEKVRCEAARSAIQVDWECRLETNFSDVNLGCKGRVSSGIDWVFQQAEEAVILEDDCLPAPSFFYFCQELLARYRNDERVSCIAGMNLYPRPALRGNETYFFARYGPTNGWASWRRAWKYFDVNLSDWPQFKRSGRIKDLFPTRVEQLYWTLLFDSQYRGEINTWDYQWLFARLAQGGLTAVSSVNMVANMGFRADATHAREMPELWAPAKECHDLWDIVHPEYILPNRDVDNYYFEKFCNGAVGTALFGLRQLAKSLRAR